MRSGPTCCAMCRGFFPEPENVRLSGAWHEKKSVRSQWKRRSARNACPLTCIVPPLLARFKQPRELILVEQLPRNTMGKVQKAALREASKDRLNRS